MPLNPAAVPHEVRIEPPGLAGFLAIPPHPKGVVVFAHGSGSGRMSPRNGHVAGALQEAMIGTLLLDLLTPEEETDRRNVFDIDLLAVRLRQATDWIMDRRAAHGLPIGYFGASTGAGAALRAAASRGPELTAVVSRGGRPDLAIEALPDVRAAVLLLVGGLDEPVIELNRKAIEQIRSRSKLTIIPGAGHLFEEPGKLDEVIHHARAWFLESFGERPDRAAEHERPHLR